MYNELLYYSYSTTVTVTCITFAAAAAAAAAATAASCMISVMRVELMADKMDEDGGV
jgi:hypothetical protein